MIHSFSTRIRLAPALVFTVSAGFAVIMFSSCARREGDMDKRVSSSRIMAVTSDHSISQFAELGAQRPAKVMLPTPQRGLEGVTQVLRSEESNEEVPMTTLPSGEVALGSSVKTSGGDVAVVRSAVFQLPLAVVGLNPALQLNSQQTAEIVRLGQEFLAETEETASVAQPSSTPALPADVTHDEMDQAIWHSAQEESDDLFRMLFGADAFNSQQLARAQQAYREQLKGE